MADAVAAAPGRASAPIGRKLLAIAVFLLAALLLYYVDKLPSAIRVDGLSPWKASRMDGLVLYGLPAKQVLEFSGAPGAGLAVRAPAVRPTPEMLATLAQGGVARPGTKAVSLTWLARTDPGGKIGFTVANQRDNPQAGLALFATGNADIPQLRLTPVETALTVTLQSVPGDSAAVPSTSLTLGAAQVPQPLATMMPVSFELPPGASVVLTFPSAQAMEGASFRLGVPASADELASNLTIDRFEIGRRRSDAAAGAVLARAEEGVCGADAGSFLARRLRPLPEDCGQDGGLAVDSIDVTPEQVEINVSGSGFVTKDGVTVAAGLLTNLANNKVVAALLGIAYATLAAWVWKTMTGMGKPS